MRGLRGGAKLSTSVISFGGSKPDDEAYGRLRRRLIGVKIGRLARPGPKMLLGRGGEKKKKEKLRENYGKMECSPLETPKSFKVWERIGIQSKTHFMTLSGAPVKP